MIRKMTFIFACSMLFSTSYATTIYQWVDANGQTHFSDTVPARYKGSATQIDTSASRVSEKERQEALERVAKEKEQIVADSKALAEAAAAEKAVQAANSKNAAPVIDNKNADCEQLMHAYRESQECFAPYMRVEGGTREEAYKHCKSVVDPSSQCAGLGEIPKSGYP